MHATHCIQELKLPNVLREKQHALNTCLVRLQILFLAYDVSRHVCLRDFLPNNFL